GYYWISAVKLVDIHYEPEGDELSHFHLPATAHMHLHSHYGTNQEITGGKDMGGIGGD
ncbi:hypothetical protein MMC14_010184, partial [Varicellaria rhodocarpa]|nr:hypothetical protein [Varicellaria rhodocarpa]